MSETVRLYPQIGFQMGTMGRATSRPRFPWVAMVILVSPRVSEMPPHTHTHTHTPPTHPPHFWYLIADERCRNCG